MKTEVVLKDGTKATVYTYAYECSPQDLETLQRSVDRQMYYRPVGASCVDPFEQGEKPSHVDRNADPIVLTGEALEELIGKEPQSVVAFRYSDSWEQVPVQIDERTTVICRDTARVGDGPDPGRNDISAYADENTSVGPDPDPTIDSDDELVFMLKDIGVRPKAYAEPKGVIAGSGVEVEIVDPDTSNALGYIYLFTHDGSLSSDANRSYGEYTFLWKSRSKDYEADPNAEDSWFISYDYRRHFVNTWWGDVIKITTPGSTAADILDIVIVWNEGITQQMNGGPFFTNLTGPIRSIRSYHANNSGGCCQRTHLFYERREDIIGDFRMHPIGIPSFFDFDQEAIGMKYYSCFVPQGVTIDGVQDEFAAGRYNSLTLQYNEAWSMVTGDQGTLVFITTMKTNIDINFIEFYDDNATPDLRQIYNDDGLRYRAMGNDMETMLPATGGTTGNYFRTTSTIYYLSPEISTADARQLSSWVYHPVTVEVKKYE